MAMDDIKALIDTTIKAEVVKALNSAPEAIDKLVHAALEQEVGPYGDKPDYHTRNKMPYLTWLVGDEIRRVAREAVQEVVAANRDKIGDAVRSRFSADDMVAAFAAHVLKAVDEDWKITINFSGNDR